MEVTMASVMARKSPTASPTGFGKRLVALRKARGLTQVQLADAIHSTQRAISYYENEAGYPPAPVVADLALALGVTTDELLGVRPSGRTRCARRGGRTTPSSRSWS